MAMLYPFYEPGDAEVEELFAAAPLGRLITYGALAADVGLFPFVRTPAGVEIHMNKRDPQLTAVLTSPAVVFQVDDVLARIPSHWIDPRIATYADVLYRSVTLFGMARLEEDEERLIDHLEELLQRHQTPGSHAPLHHDRSLYAAALSRIRLICITEERRQSKFKLGQQEPAAIRARVIEELRNRGSETDVRAAEYVERTLDVHSAR